MADEYLHITGIDIPRLSEDGSLLELSLRLGDGTEVSHLIPTPDLEKITDLFARALLSASIRHNEQTGDNNFTPTPAVFHANGLDFVSVHDEELSFLRVATLEGREVLIGFQPHQIRSLIELAREIDEIQNRPDDTNAVN